MPPPSVCRAGPSLGRSKSATASPVSPSAAGHPHFLQSESSKFVSTLMRTSTEYIIAMSIYFGVIRLAKRRGPEEDAELPLICRRTVSGYSSLAAAEIHRGLFCSARKSGAAGGGGGGNEQTAHEARPKILQQSAEACSGRQSRRTDDVLDVVSGEVGKPARPSVRAGKPLRGLRIAVQPSSAGTDCGELFACVPYDAYAGARPSGSRHERHARRTEPYCPKGACRKPPRPPGANAIRWLARSRTMKGG